MVQGLLGYMINDALAYGTGGWALKHQHGPDHYVRRSWWHMPRWAEPSPLTGSVASASGQ